MVNTSPNFTGQIYMVPQIQLLWPLKLQSDIYSNIINYISYVEKVSYNTTFTLNDFFSNETTEY